VVGLALALGATMSVVPLQVAGAQSTSTSVLVPANGAAVSGSQVIFDASATAGVTEVQFELTGGGPYSHTVIATATPTEDGWIASWNSTTATDGSYTLQSVATEGASSTTSPGISITVNNPSVAIVLPSYNAIVSGTVVLDAVTSSGATKVEVAIEAPGCPTQPPSIVPICDLGDATPTVYGWLLFWPSTEVPNGGVTVSAQATFGNGATPIASPTSFTVANPVPTVVVPTNGSTVSGTQVLDCAAPSFTEAPVSFLILGPGGQEIVSDATQTYYGWLYEWNTTNVINGSYAISCNATYGYGASRSGASISVTVAN
jgi:hypothetical protein